MYVITYRYKENDRRNKINNVSKKKYQRIIRNNLIMFDRYFIENFYIKKNAYITLRKIVIIYKPIYSFSINNSLKTVCKIKYHSLNVIDETD